MTTREKLYNAIGGVSVFATPDEVNELLARFDLSDNLYMQIKENKKSIVAIVNRIKRRNGRKV